MLEYLVSKLLGGKRYHCLNCQHFKIQNCCTNPRDKKSGFCEKTTNYFIPIEKDHKICIKFKKVKSK